MATVPRDEVIAPSTRIEPETPTVRIVRGNNTAFSIEVASGAKVEFSPPETATLAGSEWQRLNKDLIDRLPHGTTVVVNIATGQHVTGNNGLAAMDEFERVFGPDVVGWAFEVGIPLNIGGGLWALSSEA